MNGRQMPVAGSGAAALPDRSACPPGEWSETKITRLELIWIDGNCGFEEVDEPQFGSPQITFARLLRKILSD